MILPLVVLRRLDCVLEPTKAAVLARLRGAQGQRDRERRAGPLAQSRASSSTTPRSSTCRSCSTTRTNIADNLHAYIQGFSPGAREVLDRFDFAVQIDRLDKSKLLYLVVSRFCEIDLHPDAVSNLEMGYLFEELIRRFSELSNETAGEHFTPREVIRLMVNLLFIEDDDALAKPGVVRTLYDPACGTGGMLSVAEDHLRALNPGARLEVFGQELNAETYAICRSDMMIKGQDASHIHFGNTLHRGRRARTARSTTCSPTRRSAWSGRRSRTRSRRGARRSASPGASARACPGSTTARFLFLQHMISKMKPVEEGGSRLAIVFNGSPLFTGAAGSGESEIRRWIIENDWLEAIVALPDQLFYNTGISTYFWIVTNRKRPERRGKVQLVDAREFFTKMRKSLGEKRKEISAEQIDEITRLYGAFEESEKVKIFRNEAVRLPAHHRRAPAPPALRGQRRDAGDARRRARRTRSSPPTTRSASSAARRASHGLSTRPTARRPSPPSSARSEARQGRPRRRSSTRIAVRDPDAPVDHEEGQAGTRPRPPRQRERPAPSEPGQLRADPSARLASAEYREAVEEYVQRRGAALRRPTPGSTTPRPRSATRSRSPGTSTATSRHDRSRRSTPRSSSSRRRSRSCSRGDRVSRRGSTRPSLNRLDRRSRLDRRR